VEQHVEKMLQDMLFKGSSQTKRAEKPTKAKSNDKSTEVPPKKEKDKEIKIEEKTPPEGILVLSQLIF